MAGQLVMVGLFYGIIDGCGKMSIKAVLGNIDSVIGIESNDAIKELLLLYQISQLVIEDGGVFLKIPLQEEMSNVLIKSTELKNLFRDFEGNSLFIFQAKDNYNIETTPIEIDFSKLKESQNSD